MASLFGLVCLLVFELLFKPLLAADSLPREGDARTCTYATWVWNTRTKQSAEHRLVAKPFSDLTAAEKDPHSDCTVCREDQVEIVIEGLPPFQVCRHFESQVRQIMAEIQQSGFPIRSIVAYRVGLTKGPVDRRGRRTQFSHHSFGTAIDINSESNGLYTNCFQFGPGCRRMLGGVWKPGNPGTVTKDSSAYQAFLRAGWKWGGELDGRQKDFMHFSLSGD
jgi:hypothetical protein